MKVLEKISARKERVGKRKAHLKKNLIRGKKTDIKITWYDCCRFFRINENKINLY